MKKILLISTVLCFSMLSCFDSMNDIFDSEKSGLIGEYLFNGNAKDSSGHKNHGTVTTSIATPANDRKGKSSSAYYFSGSTSPGIYLNESIDYKFGYKDSFSISLWFNTSALATGGYPSLLYMIDNISQFEYLIVLTNGTSFVTGQVGINGSGVDSINGTVSTGTWYHFVLVYSSQTLTCYLNGASLGSTAYTQGAVPDSSGKIIIGGGNSQGYNGYIDDIRIYNHAISAEEVKDLYKE